MPRVMELATRLGLAVVEDACQVSGAMIAGRMAGAWGDAGVLSFGGSKLLTAGRGGALLTREPGVHQRARIHCQRGNHAFPLSELQAAVLAPQLARLAERNETRRNRVARLVARTSIIAALRPMINTLADSQSAYYKLAWHYDAHAAGDVPIDQFVAALAAEGAPVDRGFRGFAGRGERRCRRVGPLYHSRCAADSTLLLHHPILLEDIARIDALAEAIDKVARGLARCAVPSTSSSSQV